MKKTPRQKMSQTIEDFYVMRIADLLSDDPILLDVIGHRFKLVADCDRTLRRVTYQFRAIDDDGPGAL